VQVYLLRVAFDRITKDDALAVAKRLRYGGPLQWESSTHQIADYASAGLVRLTCNVAQATVLLHCFASLAEIASAHRETDPMIACANAFQVLGDGIEKALIYRRPRIK
jgi:hypothetical protein